MRLPSLRSALAEGRKTLARFPLVIADAALGTAVALTLVDFEGPPRPTILFPLLLAALAGIPLLLTCALVAEKRHLAGSRRAAVHTAGLLLLAGYALTVPANLPDAPGFTMVRFAFIVASLHLLVAWAPFAGAGETTGFWQFNRMLFVRVLESGLFSFILWAGLAIALAALDHLFGVTIPGKRYGELWILVTGVFATWFFLAGIPGDLSGLDRVAEYPRWIGVFARYVLVPLVMVYLVILYAYIVKIVAAWSWPEGWVSKLILGLAGAGIFARLLLHPSVETDPRGWAARSARWFSALLIPLSCVLALAVWRRVTEYGITEWRYTALLAAAWLAGISVYIAVSRQRSIRLIPVSLCLLAAAASVGPWGTLAVSERSQVGRLRTMLERDSILVGGLIRPAGAELSASEGTKITAQLSYLHDMHGYGGIQRWFGEPLSRDSAERGTVLLSSTEVADLMGINAATTEMVVIRPEKPASYDIRGYAHIGTFDFGAPRSAEVTLTGDIQCTLSAESSIMRFSRVHGGQVHEILTLDIGAHALNLLQRHGREHVRELPASELALTGEGEGLSVRVCPWELEFERRGTGVKIVVLDAAVAFTVTGGR